MSVIVIYIAHAEQVTPETRRATIRIQLWRPIGLIMRYAKLQCRKTCLCQIACDSKHLATVRA